MTEDTKQSWWRRLFGRSILKALFGTDVDLSNRQTAATIISLLIIGTLCWLAVYAQETRTDIIKTLSGVIFVIIGFYFGKSQEAVDDVDVEDAKSKK